MAVSPGSMTGDGAGVARPATLQLVGFAMAVSIVIGIVSGVIAAVKQYSAVDYLVTFFSFFWLSIPAFFMGLLLIYIFAVQLHWFPVFGSSSASAQYPVLDRLHHLVLPGVTLGLELAVGIAEIAGDEREVDSRERDVWRVADTAVDQATEVCLGVDELVAVVRDEPCGHLLDAPVVGLPAVGTCDRIGELIEQCGRCREPAAEREREAQVGRRTVGDEVVAGGLAFAPGRLEECHRPAGITAQPQLGPSEQEHQRPVRARVDGRRRLQDRRQRVDGFHQRGVVVDEHQGGGRSRQRQLGEPAFVGRLRDGGLAREEQRCADTITGDVEAAGPHDEDAGIGVPGCGHPGAERLDGACL